MFGHNVGPESWKRLLFPPTLELWRARRSADGGLEVQADPPERPRYALIGVRSCDLHAIAVQDRIFVEGPWADPDYSARREGAFIVAVNCGQAAATCFCVSMGTGPRAEAGFDLALTELLDARRAPLSRRGRERARRGGAGRAPVAGGRGRRRGGRRAGRPRAPRRRWAATLDTTDIRDLLYRNREHPRWDEVADRCLTCGNCTMVCPTCFCSSVDDVTDLAGEEADARARAGSPASRSSTPTSTAASVRSSTKARYRQWMTHKLASWIDQFGTSGCVGCGRCITWCPVAIDITEEAAAIRATDGEGRCGRLTRCSPRSPALAGLPAEHLELIAGCARNRVFAAGELPDARGRAGGRLLRDPPAATWRSRPTSRSAARSRSRRCTTATWSAGPGSCRRTGRCSTPAPWRRRTRSAFDGAACARKCEADHDLGYELMTPLHGRDRRAPPGDPAPAARPLWPRPRLTPPRRGPMVPVPFRVAGVRARPPTPGRSSSRPSRRAP